MPDIIDELLALDDSALMKKVGLSQRLENIKTSLSRMAALEPEFRAKAAARVSEELTPHVGGLTWTADELEKEQEEAKQEKTESETSGAVELSSNNPEEIMQ